MAVSNVDRAVTSGFGDEWSRFDQQGLSDSDREKAFRDYFGLFPWDEVGADTVGMDVGCGSGRWAAMVAPRVGKLLCVDAADAAVEVARRNLAGHANVDVQLASVDDLPVEDESLDFAYSLGVLHHVPDTAAGVASVVQKLKPGAPFLVYLYYDFENRSSAYRALWKASELLRSRVSRLSHGPRFLASQMLAGAVYYPLARSARVAERLGADVQHWPLTWYRDRSFYVMRTDALDRFGTRLEQRFSRDDITRMLTEAGCEEPMFSDRPPFWVGLARKRG